MSGVLAWPSLHCLLARLQGRESCERALSLQMYVAINKNMYRRLLIAMAPKTPKAQKESGTPLLMPSITDPSKAKTQQPE